MNRLQEELKKKLKNTFKFSDNDINKFSLLLGKGVYPCNYVDDWEKFKETTLPDKKVFCTCLSIEDIIEGDYKHGKRVCTDFEIKNLREYHDIYFRSDALLLADVFENFRKTRLKIYQLDLAKFLSTPGLAWVKNV